MSRPQFLRLLHPESSRPPQSPAKAAGCGIRGTEDLFFLPDRSRVFENEDFLTSLTALAKKANCKLTVCAQEESVDDRWMQVCALGAGGLGTREARPEGQGTRGPASRAWPRTLLATLPPPGRGVKSILGSPQTGKAQESDPTDI